MNDGATASVRGFATRAQLYDALSGEIGALIGAAVAARGRATLAVPGGSTPQPLFERLRDLELPWSAVWVTLTDERWIDPREASSNERQLREQLIRGRASRASVVGLKTDDEDPTEALATCAARLERLGGPLDAVVLGMGEDGHVASLFPGAVDPAVALDPRAPARCVAVTPPATAVAPANRRLSLTLAALVDTRRLFLIATGEAKRGLIDRALAHDPTIADRPVAAVLSQSVTRVDVWWAP